jgi:hypothetical protein
VSPRPERARPTPTAARTRAFSRGSKESAIDRMPKDRPLAARGAPFDAGVEATADASPGDDSAAVDAAIDARDPVSCASAATVLRSGATSAPPRASPTPVPPARRSSLAFRSRGTRAAARRHVT